MLLYLMFVLIPVCRYIVIVCDAAVPGLTLKGYEVHVVDNRS